MKLNDLELKAFLLSVKTLLEEAQQLNKELHKICQQLKDIDPSTL